MSDVILVGRNAVLLRMLSVVLESRGVSASLARDRVQFAKALVQGRPRVVLYQRTQDEAFDLNPRYLGFRGDLIVLTDDFSTVIKRAMPGEQVVAMPTDLERVLDMLLEKCDREDTSAAPEQLVPTANAS
jgi:hypothetical protein